MMKMMKTVKKRARSWVSILGRNVFLKDQKEIREIHFLQNTEIRFENMKKRSKPNVSILGRNVFKKDDHDTFHSFRGTRPSVGKTATKP